MLYVQYPTELCLHRKVIERSGIQDLITYLKQNRVIVAQILFRSIQISIFYRLQNLQYVSLDSNHQNDRYTAYLANALQRNKVNILIHGFLHYRSVLKIEIIFFLQIREETSIIEIGAENNRTTIDDDKRPLTKVTQTSLI